MSSLCERLLATGNCDEKDCTFRHDAKICIPCGGVVCKTEAAYNAHIRSKPHRRKTGRGHQILHCPLCVENVTEFNWAKHLSKARHIRIAEEKGIYKEVEPEAGKLGDNEKVCKFCDKIVQAWKWDEHVETREHIKMETFVEFRTAFEEAERNKELIDISHEKGVDFEVVDPLVAQRGVQKQMIIRKKSDAMKFEIVDLKVGLASSKTPSCFKAIIQGSNKTLVSDKNLHVVIEFCHPHHGLYEDRLDIVFKDVASNREFSLTRSLRVVVGDEADHLALRPKAPYTPKTPKPRHPEREVVPGVPPPPVSTVKWVTKLPFAVMPKELFSMLKSDSKPYKILEALKATKNIPLVLKSDTHMKHFRALLWIEEFAMQIDLESFDMQEAKLKKHNVYHHLDVPGLAENKPSLLIGDQVLVQRHGTDKGHWFVGHVHYFTPPSVVGLRFEESIGGHRDDAHYRIRFKLNRIALRRQHEALSISSKLRSERLFFPKAAQLIETIPPIGDLRNKVVNRLIAGNDEQLQAVASITQLPPGSIPFVVFGPPGTGKTVTIVEAIQQLLRQKPSAKILACAPSNSAADLIASRLLDLGSKLFRLNAPSRGKGKVPDEILPFTYCEPGSSSFSAPPLETLRGFRVIVSTCLSAAVLHGVGLARGHFSYVFIDEAAQATEPEIAIPIKTLSSNSTNVVLSGDPQQLGPIIHSAIAKALHFEASFMERLMGTEPSKAAYHVQAGHGKSIVKLLNNFRSHEDIIHFSNLEFYKNELKVCANPTIRNSYVGWSRLPNKSSPVIFHSVSSDDQREGSLPSYFNISEITLVKQYVKDLLDDRRRPIAEEDIGVITCYNAQVLRIRRALQSHENIKVGSVEEFQGQERRVIIISTVRASKEYINYNLRQTMGFVADRKRLNVAITRAKALLIIIGDATVLSIDPVWRRFLNYIYAKQGWRGDPPDWDPRKVVSEFENYDDEVMLEGMDDMDKLTLKVKAQTLNDTNLWDKVEEAEGDEKKQKRRHRRRRH